MEPGSKVVLQMHYNTVSAAPMSDRSSFGVTITDEVEHRAMVLPFTNFRWAQGEEPMMIPAGESSVTHSFESDRNTPFLNFMLQEIDAKPEDTLMIGNVGMHMHQLGHRGRLALKRGSGEESCLVEIDDWDFGWQGSYDLAKPVAFGPQDTLSVSCEWDNSPENQPIIDGEIAEPSDVEWGEGSYDEMCLSTLYISK